jgi:hypothetical protein
MSFNDRVAYIKPRLINTDFIRIRVQVSLGRICGHNGVGSFWAVTIGGRR